MNKFKNLSDFYSNKKIKKFLQVNEEKIKDGITFTTKCLNDFQNLINNANNVNVVSYAQLALKFKLHYDEIIRKKGWHRVSKNWKMLNSFDLNQIIVDLIEKDFPNSIVSYKSDNMFFAFCDKFTAGWQKDRNEVSSLAVEEGSYSEFLSYLRDRIWTQYDKYIVMDCPVVLDRAKIVLSSEEFYNYIVTDKAIEVTDYLFKFLNKKINRAILFYGPPGTGKSNLTRSIAAKLDKNALKITSNFLRQFSSSYLRNILEILNAEVIIFEDLDHIAISDNSQILYLFEYLAKSGKIVLASVNRIHGINPALLRPGRFDELIELNKLEDKIILDIVGGDTEIFNLVKNFPVAYIIEVMNRIEVLGREHAIKSIEELKQRFNHTQKNLHHGFSDRNEENSEVSLLETYYSK